MPRSTIGATVERIRRQLASSYRYEISVLGALMNSATTTVQFLYDLPPSLRNGAVLSIDNEVLRVLAVDTAAKTATVIRGWQDSVAAAHVNGTEVWINPRFTAVDIYEALVDELSAWGPDLFRVVNVESAVLDGAQTLQLPASMADAYGVIGVWLKATGSAAVPFVTTAWPALEFRLMRADTSWSAATTSGILLRFTGGGGRVCAGTALIQAAVPFDTASLEYTDDLVDDVGLADSMLDVLAMGVKCRLMGDQEINRSARVAQDLPRNAEEVPAMAANEVSQRLFPVYQRRKGEEINRLRHRYPVQFT